MFKISPKDRENRDLNNRPRWDETENKLFRLVIKQFAMFKAVFVHNSVVSNDARETVKVS